MMSTKNMYHAVLLGGLLALPLLSYADDTEIYFNPKQTTVKPNVFFILDRSISMKYDPNGKRIGNSDDPDAPDEDGRSKLNLMKEAFQLIFAKEQIGGFRVGVMDYGTGDPNITQAVVDVDGVDHSRDIGKLWAIDNGSTMTWYQPVWIPTDDGYQNGLTHNNWLDFNRGLLNAASVTRYFAYRFDNILLHAVQVSGEGAPNYGIVSAKLSLPVRTSALNANYKKQLEIAIDPNLDSQYLRPRTKNDLSTRYSAAKASAAAYIIKCDLPASATSESTNTECDVTDLVRRQIARNGWVDGNAITFIVRNAQVRISTGALNANGYLYFKESGYNAYLKITASKAAIADNRRTIKETIVDKVFKMQTSGSTYTNRALLTAAQYISNIYNSKASNTNVQGPYHSNGRSKYSIEGSSVSASAAGLASPLTEGCQLTHFILMSDGQPSSSNNTYINYYMYGNGTASKYCEVNESGVSRSAEKCGRALAKWLSKTNSGNFGDAGPNYIRTNTIGFGMVADDEGDGADPTTVTINATNYLRDLASYGDGAFYATNDVDDLVDAFRSIINNALSVSTTAVSGQVLTSATNMMDQRREVFYTFYQSGAKDYWPGNTKGFKMSYPKVTLSGKQIEIPVLKDWYSDNLNAVDSAGNFNAVSSAWSKNNADPNKNVNGDAANINAGGVVNQLPFVEGLPNRPLYTALNGTALSDADLTSIRSSATNILPSDLGFDSTYNPDKNNGASKENRTKALLDFMRGYVYNVEGTTAARGKKLGDSIASGVTLVSYGCSSGTTIVNCDYNNLNLVGFLTSNDGVFRAYNLTTGEVLYEFMPKEMLHVIDKIQKERSLDTSYVKNDGTFVKQIDVKTYGLDGNVVVYHDDPSADKKGFITGASNEAFAYVTAGRGGAYLYLFDVSTKDKVRLVKTHTAETLANPVLGETWSEPVVGKIKTGDGKVTPVIVFGAGYNPTQNNQDRGLETDNVGNGVYMLNAKTGEVLWHVTTNYSVPGGVAAYTKVDGADEYITDLFFGDMGGQLWRFHMNKNGSIAGNNLFTAVGNSNGVIATISSGSGASDHRRFYQKPFVYNLTKDGVEGMLSINIGSGYKAHPLVTGNQDRFYSFRVPESVDKAYNQPITEDDLGVLTLDTVGDTYVDNGASIAKGFMVQLQSSVGEKILSNPYVLGGTLVFSSYVPPSGVSLKSCVPNSGKQRTYSIDVVTGKNLLETPYIETETYSIPSDTAVYCGERYCSMITNVGMLDGTANNFDCVGENCKLPFTFDKGGDYVKAGWTDVFSL